MRHTVRLHHVIVGHSDLENVEPGVGRAWGVFRPGLGYDLIQPVFRLFAHAVPRDGSPADDAVLARYQKARATLDLELQDWTGSAIRTSALRIVDYSVEEGSGSISLDVLITDDAYWARRLTVEPSA